jgi:hypothetical protein
MATSLPVPVGLPLDAASWDQTPVVVRQLVVHLLAIIQQQETRIAALDARVSQNSHNSDRLPSSDPPQEKRGQPAPGRRADLAPSQATLDAAKACWSPRQ